MTTEQPTRGIAVQKMTKLGFIAESMQVIWHKIDHATGIVSGKAGFFKDDSVDPLEENAMETFEFTFQQGDFTEKTTQEQMEAIAALYGKIATLPNLQ